MKSVNENYKKAVEIVKKMTIDEKISLSLGSDFWHTKEIERLGLKSIQVSDGPHGLRKENREKEDKVLSESYKSTCFPLACATSCSFDKDLLEEMGDAISKECLKENVQVILGPGTNIKRSPLCGRNFEYFSEDPLLAGVLSSAFINGVQKNNVGVSLKHFFGNNQETFRFVSNSVIDERAIKEIYLKPFEIAVKSTKPSTIMSSYNIVNSEYVGESKRYLNDILRDEWGFEGIVISDWGAVNNRVQGLKSGCNLEMPYSGKYHQNEIKEAIKNGTLEEKELDKSTIEIVSLILATMNNEVKEFDKNKHNELARRIARESAVLLRNEENILPLSKNEKIAIVGSFAENSRYQGSGSSRINPFLINNPLDELNNKNIKYTYAKGYSLQNDEVCEELINEAVEIAKEANKVIAFVGLPDYYESEGYDRTNISMPNSHNKLIEELVKVNKNIIVIIYAGSSVLLPWKDKVKSILLMNLSGQNNGGAFYDLVFGDYSPSGRLAETYPEELEDVPSYKNFATYKTTVYKESIYVGYRYYEKASKKVNYPFGFGLSYTTFEYKNLKVVKKDDNVEVTIDVINTGKRKAKTVIQLYVSMLKSNVYRPIRELKSFTKIELDANEAKTVSFELNKDHFSFYNQFISKWQIERGNYYIEICDSAIKPILSEELFIDGEDIKSIEKDIPSYYHLENGIFDISKEEFEKIYQGKIPEDKTIKPFHMNSVFREFKKAKLGKLIHKIISKKAPDIIGSSVSGDVEAFADAMIGDMPIRGIAQGSGGIFSLTQAEGLVDLLNGKFFKGVRKLLKKEK